MTKALLPISFLFFASCEKEEETPIYYPGEMEFGALEGKKNGKDWIASGWAVYHSLKSDAYFGILAYTYNADGFNREVVSFGEIPLSTGKYEVSLSTAGADDCNGYIGANYGTSRDDGDVGEDSYKVYEETDNWLEVTFIDTIEGVARGAFDVTFKIKGEKVNPANPDKVRFSEGTFDLKFDE